VSKLRIFRNRLNPKVIASALSAVTATGLISFLRIFNVTLDPSAASAIVAIAAAIAGWVRSAEAGPQRRANT
jgi:hypothetical protein